MRGEEEPRGDPRSGRPRRCVTKTSDDFRLRSFHLSLCFGADNTSQHCRRCKNEATRRCGGPIDSTEGPSKMRRTRLRCEGPADSAEGPSMMQTTHRVSGGSLDSAEDPAVQWRTPRLTGGPIG